MSIIILIPGLIAAYVAFTQSPHRAFLNVYVPVVLFLPTYYAWKVPAFPDPNFQQATVLALMAVWLIRGIPGWRFSFADILVFGYAFSVMYSEYSNVGYTDSQNYISDTAGAVLFPYILAKSLVEPAGLREEFAKRIVFILVIVAVLSAFQSVTLSNFSLWPKVFGRFFGGQGYWIPTQYRWGLPRASGPYGHAILAGIVMVVGYRIQRWLEWSQVWPPRLRYLPSWLPISTAQLFTLIMFGGALITLVRGPLSAAVMAAIVILIGRSKKRWLISGVLLISLIIIGIPTTTWFIGYASIDPETAETKSHKTVAYRWQLINNYLDVGKERLVWGWGLFGWPKVKAQKSIDNHYLLLFLRHGIMGFGFLVAIFLFMMVRLFIHSMLQPVADPPGSLLGFTLLSLYIVVGWSIATVWLGQQTVHLLFLIVGWSEGYLHSGPEKMRNVQTLPRSRHPFQFRRILK